MPCTRSVQPVHLFDLDACVSPTRTSVVYDRAVGSQASSWLKVGLHVEGWNAMYMEILMEYDDGDVAQVNLMEFGWPGGGRQWTWVHELWGSICRSTTAYSHSVHWFCFHCHACSSSTCSSRRHEITSDTAGHMKVVKNARERFGRTLITSPL
ncbi:hypothetical protein ACQJBY_068850 [Aegilops geniculata]